MIVRLLFRATEKVTKRSRAFRKRGKQLIIFISPLLVLSLLDACMTYFEEAVTVGVNKNFPFHVL